MSESYVVYTDGACLNNQAKGGQPGGWGAVFLDGRTFSGYDLSTTNNRMELTAAMEALKNTPIHSEVELYSDSAYLINAFTQHWIENWIKKGWKTSKGTPVENQDLWEKIISLEKDRNVKWLKVKGHSGNHWNEKADELAVEAISKHVNHSSETSEHHRGITLHLTSQQFQLIKESISEKTEKNNEYKELFQYLKSFTSI